LAPRKKELRSRQDELNRAKVLADAEAAAQSVPMLDAGKVKAYVAQLRELISTSELSECKSFLRAFVKKIVVENGQVTIHYFMPMIKDGVKDQVKEVLPIETIGGAEEIRTLYLCDANAALSQMSYSPVKKVIILIRMHVQQA
jgi:site-specific DNA recombinase